MENQVGFIPRRRRAFLIIVNDRGTLAKTNIGQNPHK
jgi:hypothetical protein